MIDLVLLRLMKYRKDFYQIWGVLPKDSKSVDALTLALLADFKKYFDAFPSHDKIDLATFIPRFKAWHPALKEEQMNSYQRTIVAALTVDTDDDQKHNIMSWLADLEMATKAANLIEEYQNGELDDLHTGMINVMDQYRRRLDVKFNTWIDTPIGELLQEEFDDSGAGWRLHALNRAMRRLRGGDFGIVAGRPDKGKTTFLTSECTYLAPQLAEDKNVLWLNNEGHGRRIIPRLYQSALGISMTEMKAMHMDGKLVDAYRRAVGGRLDKIRVVDIHGLNNGQVEMIIEDNNPGVVIYDMIDNIKGFGEEARTDRQLEEMYKWARERSVKYDLIGLATSQISNDGDGMQFPTLGMLKDSKTGKQGACDFQLMIGASNDPGFATSRFLGLPKNKLRRPDGPADPRAEVYFDAVKARYVDIDHNVPGTTEQPTAPSSEDNSAELAAVL